MALILESKLEEVCARDGLDLHKKLDRIKRSTADIWAVPRLIWFTDHTISHSERIIELLAQIVANLQETNQALTAIELYILLAACYLHDIGMQDFKADGRSMDSFTIKDYELIRRQHPARGRELILHQSWQHGRDQFHIDLDDNPSFTVPIALVSQGHGSDFFETSVKSLTEMPHSPGGKKIRGPLLTALLLIADELDLHEERARFPKEMDLSPVSALHHHLHHYVADVRVITGNSKQERKIALSLDFPAGSDEYAEPLRIWLTSKLQRQLRRTAQIIEAATDGELRWSPGIDVRVTTDSYGIRRPLPRVALVEVMHQLAKIQTVDYTEIRRKLETAILHRPSPHVFYLVANDEHGIAHLMRWLEVNVTGSNISLWLTDFRSEPFGVSDVLSRLSRWLLPDRTANFIVNAEPAENEFDVVTPQALDELLSQVKQQGAATPGVLIFQNLDDGDRQTTNWLTRILPSRLRHFRIPIPVMISCRNLPAQLRRPSPNRTIFTLGPFSQDDISVHLRNSFGFDTYTAGDIAEEIYGTSNHGQPAGVLFALARMRNKEVSLAP
jgi:hypothetical protein